MIAPLVLARLVLRAYDTAFIASGVAPDLSDLGFVIQKVLWGRNSAGPKPFGFLACPADGSGGQVIAARGTNNLGDALSDANIRLVSSPWRGGVGRVHLGFSSLTNSFGWGPQISDLLAPIVSLAQLALGGHSEGAAALRQLSMKLGHVGQIATWGEPKSCDKTAADYALTCAGQSRRAFNPNCAVHLVPGLDLLDVLDPYESTNDPFPLRTWGNPLDIAGCHSMAGYVTAEQSLALVGAA